MSGNPYYAELRNVMENYQTHSLLFCIVEITAGNKTLYRSQGFHSSCKGVVLSGWFGFHFFSIFVGFLLIHYWNWVPFKVKFCTFISTIRKFSLCKTVEPLNSASFQKVGFFWHFYLSNIINTKVKPTIQHKNQINLEGNVRLLPGDLWLVNTHFRMSYLPWPNPPSL